MAGTCINVIKLIGLGSLGLLTTQLNYQFFQIIPNYINQISNHIITSSNSNIISSIKNQLINSRIIQGVLNVLSTGCFLTAYNYSSINEKHPYLIYSAIPASLIYLLYQNYTTEERLLTKLNQSTTTTTTTTTTPTPPKTTTKSKSTVEHPLSDSDDFVHVSDSDDSTTSTTTPTPIKSKEDIEVDEEVKLTFITKEIDYDLKTLKRDIKLVQ